MYQPKVDDLVLVDVTRGGKSVTVRARVRYVQDTVYSVVLLENAMPGWEAGDTYRTASKNLYPVS